MGRPICNFSEPMDKIFDLWDSFKADKEVKKVIGDPDSVFYNLVKSEMRMPLEVLRFNKELTKGDVRGLKRRLDNLVSNIKKGEMSGNLAAMMYTPEAFAKRDPAAGELLNEFIHTAQYHKGLNVNSKGLFNQVMFSLKEEMQTRGFIQNGILAGGKKMTRTSAQAQADRLEESIIKAKMDVKNDTPGAMKRLQALEQREIELYRDSELQVYDDMRYFIEGDLKTGKGGLKELTHNLWTKAIEENKKLAEKSPKKKKFIEFSDIKLKDIDFEQLKDRDGNTITPPMRNAIIKYHELMGTMYKTLKNGTESYIDAILFAKKGTVHEEGIVKIKESLTEQLMPSYETGYYPHFARDLNIDFIANLMPKLDDLVLATSNYKQGATTPKAAIDQLQNYLSGYTRTRSEGYDFSPNFMNVVGTYINEVNRFNYISRINRAKADVLNKVESMYKKGESSDHYVENVVSFINDLHAAAVGKNSIKNPQTAAFVRTLLGFEFISKLGMNPRSAARNASQMFLNLVQFSPGMIRESTQTVKGLGLGVEQIMMEKGLLFTESAAELEESIGINPSMHKMLEMNQQSGKLEFRPMTKMEKVAKGVSTVAGSTPIAGMMRKVENINRGSTFKIGYGRMYKMLQNPQFTEYINSKLGKKATSKEVEKHRKHYAENYAVNMVMSLHFDYNDFSKARGIRGPVGKVLGQFQHFGFKFAEKNWEFLRKGADDIMSRELTGTNALNMYRLGLVYFAAPYLASMLIPVDWGNLIEHDTYNRLEKMGTLFWGDDDDIKKAFYGKGPIMGQIGAPVISDLMTIGSLYDIINMDEDGLGNLLLGYQDYGNLTGDQKTYQVLRTLNTTLGRFTHRTMPQLVKGNLGYAVQSELGLYHTDKKAQKQAEKYAPGFYEALEALEEFGKVGSGKKKKFR